MFEGLGLFRGGGVLTMFVLALMLAVSAAAALAFHVLAGRFILARRSSVLALFAAAALVFALMLAMPAAVAFVLAFGVFSLAAAGVTGFPDRFDGGVGFVPIHSVCLSPESFVGCWENGKVCCVVLLFHYEASV